MPIATYSPIIETHSNRLIIKKQTTASAPSNTRHNAIAPVEWDIPSRSLTRRSVDGQGSQKAQIGRFGNVRATVWEPGNYSGLHTWSLTVLSNILRNSQVYDYAYRQT